jgi:hypothetical protein
LHARKGIGGDRKPTHFYNKQQPPIRDGYLDTLNPVGEQATKCTSNGGKAEPRSDSGAVFGFGIIECLGEKDVSAEPPVIESYTKV